VLRENDSLLIGGLVREERTTDESGVPTIRKIPVIGFFFKQRANPRSNETTLPDHA
jgi:type II secretory pathway component GspD/PulD (secretin)